MPKKIKGYTHVARFRNYYDEIQGIIFYVMKYGKYNLKTIAYFGKTTDLYVKNSELGG
jgi:hypothetical protein